MSEDFDYSREPLVVLGHKGATAIEDIVGTEPLTSNELIRRLWDWIRANELLRDRMELG